MKSLIQKYPVHAYFVLAYLISWLVWLPMILLYLQNRPAPIPLTYLFPAAIGVYGPTLAAILTTALVEGQPGLRALLAKYRLWKTAPGWYAYIFLLYPAIFLVGSLLYILFSGASPSLHLSHLFNLPLIFLLAIPFGPLGEELGWRGFALPRLQARLGTFSASLLLGVLWFGWHLPAALVPGVALPAVTVTWEVLLNYLTMLVGFSMLFTFLYNQTGGSVLLSILLHAVINSTAQSINPLLWGKLPAGQLMPLLWCVAAMLWAVIFMLLWKRPPQRWR